MPPTHICISISGGGQAILSMRGDAAVEGCGALSEVGVFTGLFRRSLS